MLSEVAKKFIGIPYIWEGFDDQGLDCSGLVQKCLLIDNPSFSIKRKINCYTLFNVLIHEKLYKISDSIEKDDILFFGESDKRIIHVGIAVNSNVMIESAFGGKKITTPELAKKYGAFVLATNIKRRNDLLFILRKN